MLDAALVMWSEAATMMTPTFDIPVKPADTALETFIQTRIEIDIDTSDL